MNDNEKYSVIRKEMLSVSNRYFGNVMLGLVEHSSVAVLEMDAMKR